MNTTTQLDNFTRSYLAACLWSSNDESTPAGGEPFDKNYTLADFAPEAIERAMADCARFQAEQAGNLELAGLDADRAGHCFWLNRCEHGSGFWDEKMESAGDSHQEAAACSRLSDASHVFGNLDPYLGNDGQIYFA